MGFWNWLFGQEGGAGADQHVSQSKGGTAVATDRQGSDGPPVPEERECPWWAPAGATLIEVQPMVRPDLCTEARSLESMLVSHFDGHDLNMPPLPHVVERVLSKLRDPKCSLSTIADIISEDQVVAGGVLRIANSPLYRGLNRITALRPAVARLGTRALQTLMMHESVRSTMFKDVGSYKEFARVLWQCSVASACAMRGLAKFTGVDPEEAFLVGLLHDIGSVIVLRIAHHHKQVTHFELDIDTFDYLCAETHQEFGELIADAWKLPDTLRGLIADHHGFPTEEDPLRKQRLMLQISDMACSLLGYAAYQPYKLPESRAVKELGLGARADFFAFLQGTPATIEETLGDV